MTVAAGKGEGQLPHQLEVIGKGGRTSFHCLYHHTTEGYAPFTPSGLAHLCPSLQGQLYDVAQESLLYVTKQTNKHYKTQK